MKEIRKLRMELYGYVNNKNNKAYAELKENITSLKMEI